MMKFGITVREILAHTFVVEADDLDEAMDKVRKSIEQCDIILDADDFIEREIEPCKRWEDGKIPRNEDVSYLTHI